MVQPYEGRNDAGACQLIFPGLRGSAKFYLFLHALVCGIVLFRQIDIRTDIDRPLLKHHQTHAFSRLTRDPNKAKATKIARAPPLEYP